jgi:hypothetical protein
MSLPSLTTGHVINHAPDGHAVYVMLRSGESPVLPIQVGTHGPNDALRGHHRPLPGRGTWGLIAFPHGSAQNGVWVTSYATNSQDAVTAGPGDTAVDYHSHLSGYHRLLDQNGNLAEVFPDGSSYVVGNGGTVPTFYRHIVDSTGARIRVPFTQAERRPTAAPPMPRVFTGPGGSTISVTADGVVNEFSASGQRVNIGAMGDTLYRLIDERFVALFNSHQHTNVTSGGGVSGPPQVSQQIVIGSQTTSHLFAG